MTWTRLLVLLLALMAACGESMVAPDVGGGADAGTDDDADSPRDSGGTGDDADTPGDSGGGGDDASTTDAAGVDASAPDAGPEPCDTPGETRIARCGMCGRASDRCGPDGFWERVSGCIGSQFPGRFSTESAIAKSPFASTTRSLAATMPGSGLPPPWPLGPACVAIVSVWTVPRLPRTTYSNAPLMLARW